MVVIVRTKGDGLLDGWRHRGMLIILVTILRISRNGKVRQGALIKSRQELIMARVGFKVMEMMDSGQV